MDRTGGNDIKGNKPGAAASTMLFPSCIKVRICYGFFFYWTREIFFVTFLKQKDREAGQGIEGMEKTTKAEEARLTNVNEDEKTVY